MNNIDEIYNQALQMLKKGHSKEEVLVKFASVRNELASLLDISSVLLSVPKNIVPTPLMRRKYASVKVKTFWLAWLHVSKFASVSVGLMLLISAFSVTAYQVSISTPGNTLFALKKGEENFRLVLASSQKQKASLQVAMAEQRLTDAQEIFGNPASNEQQKTAALNELAAQTTSAVAEVNTVAAADPKSTQSPPLLSSLDNITQQQQKLLTAINKPDGQVKTAASKALVALGANTAKLSAIKQSIAVASNDQEALAKLNSDPNSIAAFGQITQASSTKITVEQITFDINNQTVIKDISGNNLLPGDLAKGYKASVVGEKNENLLIAQQIFITSTSTATSTVAALPEVKSDSTGTSTSPSSTTPVINTKKPTDQTSTSTAPDPNVATGLFMFEDPTPQVGK